jgi:hypothetical protein
MISGYPGIRITETGLDFNPQCVEGGTFIKVKSLHYLDSIFDYSYDCISQTPKMNNQLQATNIQLNILQKGKIPIGMTKSTPRFQLQRILPFAQSNNNLQRLV